MATKIIQYLFTSHGSLTFNQSRIYIFGTIFTFIHWCTVISNCGLTSGSRHDASWKDFFRGFRISLGCQRLSVRFLYWEYSHSFVLDMFFKVPTFLWKQFGLLDDKVPTFDGYIFYKGSHLCWIYFCKGSHLCFSGFRWISFCKGSHLWFFVGISFFKGSHLCRENSDFFFQRFPPLLISGTIPELWIFRKIFRFRFLVVAF